MRREATDELLRNFLAINALLRGALRALRQRIARDAETKRNPNWALQPRAPRGTPQGGQWTSSGASQQTSARSPASRLPTPRQGPSTTPGLLSIRRLSPLALATMLAGDTPQPVVASYRVPGTDDLLIEHRFVPQTQTHSARFLRVITPERRVPVAIFGRPTGIQAIEPRRLAQLDVEVSIDGDNLAFDPRALARAYGREIPGVTSGASPRRPELVPVTPEEQLLVYNLRALGAGDEQVSVSLQNLRGRSSDVAFIASMRRNGATRRQITAGLREIRRARNALRRRGVTLGHNRPPPDVLADIFPGITNAPPSSIILPLPGAIEGPATDFTSDTETRNMAQALIRDIRAIDPNFRSAQPQDTIPETIEGRREFLEGLRLEHAAALFRTRGDAGPLQLEMLRYIQRRVNIAYAEAEELADAGKLKRFFSRGEAIGNHIDKTLRMDLRRLYARLRIPITAGSRVGVHRWAYNTSGPTRTYSIPDSWIDNVIFDVSLEAKSPRTEQIIEFFNSDFGPTAVIIIRPEPVGQSYLITAPGG